MEDTSMLDIPDESMQHINALLARHPPGMIQRMFSQTIETRMCFANWPLTLHILTIAQADTPMPRPSCPQIPSAQTLLHLLVHHGGRVYPWPRPFLLPPSTATRLPLLLLPIPRALA